MAGKKRDHEVEEDDVSVEGANERAYAEIEKAKERDEPEPEREEPEDEIEVEGDDDDEVTPRVRRRQERQGLREENERLQAELAQARSAQQQLIASQIQAMQRQPAAPPADVEDEFEREAQEALNEQQWLSRQYQSRLQALDQMGQKMDPAEEQDFLRRAQIARRRETDAYTAAAARRAGIGPQQPQVNPVVLALNHQYSDVINNLEARAEAQKIGMIAAARAGLRHPNLVMYEESLKQARATVLARQRGGTGRPPTERSRAKFAGQSSGPGGGAGEKRTTITREEKKMADYAYPHIKDDQKRYRHFFNEQRKQASKESPDA